MISEIDIYEIGINFVKNNLGFRSWYYFRTGWSTYFAFILAALNTLTVTYYLAVEKIPVLNIIFPSFAYYILTFVSIGIPVLIATGYIHFKRTQARKAEVDIGAETNPYLVRQITNTELLLKINMKLMSMMITLQNGKKLSDSEMEEITKMSKEIQNYVEKRNFAKEKDIDYFKEIGSTKIR